MYVIERFHSSHLLEVMRLSVQVLDEEFPWQFFSQMAAAQGKYFFVAREVETSKIVGFLIAGRQPGLSGRILLFAVDPGFQGQGVGRSLLRQAQKSLALDNVRQLHLEVRPDNRRAIAFYQHHGFSVDRLQERAYRDGSDALRMVKPLF